jgi:hypothetical protein
MEAATPLDFTNIDWKEAPSPYFLQLYLKICYNNLVYELQLEGGYNLLCRLQPTITPHNLPFYDKYFNLKIFIIFFVFGCIYSFTFLVSYTVIDLEISSPKTCPLSTRIFIYKVFQWSCTTEKLHLFNIGMYLFIISMCLFNIRY